MNVQKYNSRITSYILNTDEIAGGSGKVMLDLFNNTANDTPPHDLLLLACYITPKSDVAVTGAVSARFDLFKTSSIGTGGTIASNDAPTATAINISKMDSNSLSLSGSQVTARSAPSGGAALKAWIRPVYVFPEETNANATTMQAQNLLPDGNQIEPVVIHPSEGLAIIQGSVASVNNYVITLVFGRTEVRPR